MENNNPSRVSIKFCGGCNPRIDRGRLAYEIGKRLIPDGYELVYNSLDASFVVFLSGCNANCALPKTETEMPHVVVAANTVDSLAVDEKELAGRIIEQVRKHFD